MARKQAVQIACTGAAMLLLLSACSSNTSPSDSSDSKPLLAYSQPATDPYQSAQMAGIVGQFEEQGFDSLPPTNADGDPGQQLVDVKSLVNQGAEGILMAIWDAQAIKPALDYAEDKDVEVVVVDLAPAAGHAGMVVRTDNFKMGEEACEAMGPQVEPGETVLTIDGDPRSTNGRERAEGFNGCMESNYPDVSLKHVSTNWQVDAAASGIQTNFNQNPDIAGVFVHSDTVFYPTILDTLEKAGHLNKVGEPGHVALVSIDGGPASLRAIRDGYQDAVIEQPIAEFMVRGVEYLGALIAGETFEVGPTDHGSEITEYNGNLADMLPSVVVTPDTIDKSERWGDQEFAIKEFAG